MSDNNGSFFCVNCSEIKNTDVAIKVFKTAFHTTSIGDKIPVGICDSSVCANKQEEKKSN